MISEYYTAVSHFCNQGDQLPRIFRADLEKSIYSPELGNYFFFRPEFIKIMRIVACFTNLEPLFCGFCNYNIFSQQIAREVLLFFAYIYIYSSK